MSWHPCRKCGALRKVDTNINPKGWDQPPCFTCGDPAYFETDEEHAASELKDHLDWVASQDSQGL